jgi:hypothetical protein
MSAEREYPPEALANEGMLQPATAGGGRSAGSAEVYEDVIAMRL